MTAVTVFCSSSSSVDRAYHDVADELGTAIGDRGWTLVFGGTATGTMHTVATSVRRAGGRVVGVGLASFRDLGILDPDCDEIVVPATLGERKQELISRADAIVVLPGGPGTLDEVTDVIARRQLGIATAPMFLLDHGGFFTPLLAMFELMAAERFAAPAGLAAYDVVPDVLTAVTAIARLGSPEPELT